MFNRQLSDISRAARHLIQAHGARAAGIALKRAVYLHQCGEEAGADKWRRIADYVRTIEAGEACPGQAEEGTGDQAGQHGA